MVTLIDAASIPRSQLLAAANGDTARLNERSMHLQSAIATIAQAIKPPKNVVLIGGDTASAVLKGCKAHGLRISGPLLPQIPLSTVLGGVWNDTRIVSKAGGFGEEGDLLRIVRKLTGNAIAKAD